MLDFLLLTRTPPEWSPEQRLAFNFQQSSLNHYKPNLVRALRHMDPSRIDSHIRERISILPYMFVDAFLRPEGASFTIRHLKRALTALDMPLSMPDLLLLLDKRDCASPQPLIHLFCELRADMHTRDCPPRSALFTAFKLCSNEAFAEALLKEKGAFFYRHESSDILQFILLAATPAKRELFTEAWPALCAQLDINALDPSGRTILECALSNQNAFALALRLGADLFLRDSEALDLAHYFHKNISQYPDYIQPIARANLALWDKLQKDQAHNIGLFIGGAHNFQPDQAPPYATLPPDLLDYIAKTAVCALNPPPS